MRWLNIDEGHHELSHEPDSNAAAYEKLIQINTWYCEQVAYLANRLATTPEPGGDGSMLDHTTIIWTNELAKGIRIPVTIFHLSWSVRGLVGRWEGPSSTVASLIIAC